MALQIQTVTREPRPTGWMSGSLSLPAIRPDSGSLGPHFSADLHPLLGEVPPSQ
jgi:hypothetical protein